MPNSGSWLGVLLGDRRAAAPGCWSVRRHVGEQHLAHHEDVVAAADRVGARRTRAAARSRTLLPGAWFVLEPSKPQIGRSAPSSRIFVFDRSRAVGSVPSIQMYSALIRHCSLLCSSSAGRRRSRWPAVTDTSFRSARFPGRCPNVNALLPGPPGLGERYDDRSVHCSHGAPARLRPAHGRGARGPLHPPLVHRRPRPAQVASPSPRPSSRAPSRRA